MIDVLLMVAAIHQADPRVPEPLVQRYAADYAAVAETVDEGFALVATARVEGAFDPKVEDCRRTGDHGRSISEFQLQRQWWNGHTKREICSSNRLAASLARRALRWLGLAEQPARAFRRYVGCRAADRRVTFRVALFRRLLREVATEERS